MCSATCEIWFRLRTESALRPRADPSSLKGTSMPSATKVLFVISNLSPGGAENQLVQLICAKPRSANDLEVEVLTVGHPSVKEQVYRARLKEQGVKVTTVDRQRHAFPAFLFRLRQAIWQARPDIVHTFLPGTPRHLGASGSATCGRARHHSRRPHPVPTRSAPGQPRDAPLSRLEDDALHAQRRRDRPVARTQGCTP